MRLRGARLCLIIEKSLLTNTRIMFNSQHQLRSAGNGSLTCFVLKDSKGASQVSDVSVISGYFSCSLQLNRSPPNSETCSNDNDLFCSCI